LKAFCARDGVAREVKLELTFSRYETYEDEDKRGVQTKGTTGLRRGGQGIREDTLDETDYTAISKPTLWPAPFPAVLNYISVLQLGLLARLAEVAGATPASVRNAANRMRV
jgi:hypothetical protein